jgi:hypothetical protein
VGPEDEPRVLAVLLVAAIALYAVVWVIAGPPGDAALASAPAIRAPLPAASGAQPWLASTVALALIARP